MSLPRKKNCLTGGRAGQAGEVILLQAPKRNRNMRSGRLSWPALAALALALLLAACKTSDGEGQVASAVAEQKSSAVAEQKSSAEQSFAAAPNLPKTSEIRLEAGDKIRVTVFGEEKLTGEYQVDTAGYVALPLAGSVKAAGSTPPEFERALEAAFKKTYLRNPKVTVEVMTFRPFYVLGEVQKPGEYPYRA